MDKNIENILLTVKSSWSKDEIIRYLYRYLAKYFQRYPEYFLSDYNSQLEIFNKRNEIIFPNVICITLCEIYKSIFDDFGIESKIIESTDAEEKKVQLFSLLVRGNNSWYSIDPLLDLHNNQLHLKSCFFGYVCPSAQERIFSKYPYVNNLPLEYISELDDSLGITHINDSIESTSRNLQNRYLTDNSMRRNTPVNEIIDSKINKVLNTYIGEYVSIDGTGLIERSKMYEYFFKNILTRSEKKFVVCRTVFENGIYHNQIIETSSDSIYTENINDNSFVLKKVKKH